MTDGLMGEQVRTRSGTAVQVMVSVVSTITDSGGGMPWSRNAKLYAPFGVSCTAPAPSSPPPPPTCSNCQTSCWSVFLRPREGAAPHLGLKRNVFFRGYAQVYVFNDQLRVAFIVCCMRTTTRERIELGKKKGLGGKEQRWLCKQVEQAGGGGGGVLWIVTKGLPP